MQDLTPQLRTRLNRAERFVGWFLALAALILVTGLAFYVHNLSQRRGWFQRKVTYYTFVRNAAGLKVGDKVRLMGFDAGDIIEITAQPPDDPTYNVFVRFRVHEPYYGYLWDDSRAKVAGGDLLFSRAIEVSKGTNGAPTYAFWVLREMVVSDPATATAGLSFAEEIFNGTNLVVSPSLAVTPERLRALAALGTNTILMSARGQPTRKPTGIWDSQLGRYVPLDRHPKGSFMPPSESPAIAERLERVVNTVETALPGVLALTNQITRVLLAAEQTARRADELLAAAQPILTNTAQITARLNAPGASLGEWLIPAPLQQQLERTLGTADSTLVTARTNLALISGQLGASLVNTANLTSNLNAQVQANRFLLGDLAELIQHTDDAVQGLKRHWFLKGAFNPPTNAPPTGILNPTRGGPP